MSTMIYDEGREAFWRDMTECPYTDRARHAAWTRGWEEAKSEDDAVSTHLIDAFAISRHANGRG
jgi:ribosome modulation factor